MENTHIQKALKHLQNDDYFSYFVELDKVEMPDSLKNIYAKHKGVFISGQVPWNFHQLLEAFAIDVQKSNVVYQKSFLLFRQGRYREAINLIAQIESNHSDYFEAQFLSIRCLFEQTKIIDAIKQAKYMTNQCFHTPEMLEKLNLLINFMSIYNGNHIKYYEEVQKNAQVILKSDIYSENLKNFALDIKARSDAILVTLGLLPIEKQQEIIEDMNKVVIFHRCSGSPIEGLIARRRQAIFVLSTLSYHHLANDFFTEIKDEAKKLEDKLLQADAQLYLSLIHIEKLLKEGLDIPAKLFKDIEETIQFFEDGGCILGDAKVCRALGELFLKYGVNYGEILLRESIDLYNKECEFTIVKEILQKLHIWHIKRGEIEKAQIVWQDEQKLLNHLQISLYNNINNLAEADTLFRKGRIAESHEKLNQNSHFEEITFLSISSTLIEANILASSGKEKEAKIILEKLIKELELRGKSILLSQSQFIMSNVVFNSNPDAGIYWIDKAIQTDKELNDKLSEAQHLYHKGSNEFLRLRMQGKKQEVTDKILLNFQKAEELLIQLNTLESKELLGGLYQSLGQLYFIANDYQECVNYMNQAESIFRSLSYKPSLAFLLAHQGLFLIKMGREKGLSFYNKALELFKESEDYFIEAGIYSEFWRILYFQGIVQQEAGRWEVQEEKKLARWKESETFYTKSSQVIDQLRGYSGRGAIVQKQIDWAEFMYKTTNVYESAFKLKIFEQKDTIGAILWLEKMKGRGFLDALAETILPQPQIENLQLIKQEQALRQEKREIILSSEAIKLQVKIDELLEEMLLDSHTKDYATLRKGEPITWEKLKKTLERETQHRLLVIQYYCSPSYTLIFGMCSEWEVPRFEKVALDYQSFNNFIYQNFRQSGGVRTLLEDIGEEEWQKYQNLISPLTLWSKPNDIICFIPNGILHDLPLHTLKLNGEYLIERNPIFYSPSSSILQYSLDKDISNIHLNKLNYVFGDSQGNLVASQREANFIAEILKTKPFLGSAVTQEQIIKALQNGNMVHIAGHGEFAASDGLESGIYTAGQSKLLAKDMFGINSKANLVVLSGCETGVSERKGGDELFGMVRALLYSGVHSLMVSQWRVSDDSTEKLFTHFYLKYFGNYQETKVVALQNAMKEMISRGLSFYHWGGFVLIGKYL
jgi:CHAT domain-containing protein